MKKNFFLIICMLLLIFLLPQSCSKKVKDSQLSAFQKVQTDYYKGLYTQAAEEAGKLYNENKNFHQAALLYGKSLYMNSEYEESRKILEKLCSKYQIYPEAEKWYIRTLLQLKEHDQAISEIKKVLAFAPENIDFLQLASAAYASIDDLQSQIAFLNQIPAQSDKIARAHLELGQIYYSYLDYEKALREIDRCLLYLDDGNLMKNPVQELRERITEKKGNN